MKKFSTIALLLLLGGTTLWIVSCSKKDKDINEVSGIAADDNIAENSFIDLKDAGDQAGTMATMKGYKKSKDSCMHVKLVSYDSITKKGKLVVDFGETDCVCKDGKTRRGKIDIEYKGANGLEGSEIIYTPDNYFVNTYGVSGTKTVKYIDKFTLSIKVEKGVITKSDGSTITWSTDRVRKMIAGYDTPLNAFDDTYEITGVSSGMNSSKSHMFTILSPLVKSTGCQWIKSGRLKIEREGRKDALIDFGDGTCDDKGKLTVGSWTKDITLKKW